VTTIHSLQRPWIFTASLRSLCLENFNFTANCRSYRINVLRLLAPTEQQAKIAAYLTTDKETNFALDKSPLMRCVLFRLADETDNFVWSFHHILLDGWSWPIIFKEIFAVYESITHNQELYLPPSRPYRDYINWLNQQDFTQAEDFWRRTLADFTTPTPLVVEKSGGQISQPQQTSYIRLKLWGKLKQLYHALLMSVKKIKCSCLYFLSLLKNQLTFKIIFCTSISLGLTHKLRNNVRGACRRHTTPDAEDTEE
jgi:hypothetical protein